MNQRERLTRLFEKKEIDRVPIWLLNPIDRLGCYVDFFNNPCYSRLVPYVNDVCDNFNRRHYNQGFCLNANPEIKQGKKDVTIDGESFSVNCVSYRDLELTSYSVRTKLGRRTKYRVTDPAELRKILDIPYVKPKLDISRYSDELARLGGRGLMMTDIGDALSPLYSLMSAEDFSLATATDYDLLLEFCDVMCERSLENYRYLLEHDIGEVFFIVGAEFAGPPIVSPAKFGELSARYVKRIVDLIREYGKYSIVHYHGQLRDILDGMAYIAPDALHTIEAPPIGNCTLTEARAKLGDMILIGNIQYDDIVRLPRDELYELTKAAVLEAKDGRFILSPTAGPYEPVISDAAIDNYIAFIEAGLDWGKV